jgi:eukaryotic-like serine/threonine-protein kinase
VADDPPETLNNAPSEADATSCPTPDEVAVFMQGTMAPAAAAVFEVHLDACDACRELVSALCRADSTMLGGASMGIHDTGGASSPLGHGVPAQLAAGSIGRYTVLHQLGAGGMGVVYAAHDPELDRNVALKIVHTDIVDPDHAARVQEGLLFEARAMAQLAHPNVVAVHDLGRIGPDVFVAMELVEGQTLTRWLAEKRSWRDIVAAFVAAGRGLAAAHAAGLVHRDFKPANVLVGQDGRVRVTDFGLAQAGVPSSGAGTAADLTARQSLDGTRSGLAGTPFYMPPEQFQGGPIDARTDQFSFCVALYQALHGCHPFPGGTIAELFDAISAGSLRPLPARPRAPRRVIRAILRGLSVNPADRFPSMDDLLHALQRDPDRRAGRLLAAAAAIAIAIAVAVVAYPRSTPSSCADDAGRITAIWNLPVRYRVMQAFLAGGKPYGPAAFAEAARVLDRYHKSWTDMRLEVCEAARSGPAQASELVSLRSMCLDGRLSQMRALVQAFAGASGGEVLLAPRAVHELPDVASCADPRALLGVTPPPSDPIARATVVALRDELADVRALFDTGHYAQGLERVRPLVDKVRATSYRPLEADALFLRGMLEYRRIKLQDAMATLKDAVLAAEAGRVDDIAVRALLTIMYIESKYNGRVEQAEREMAPRVMAIIERMGGSDELEGKLHVGLSVIADEAHRYDQAVNEAARALDQLERRFGPNDFGVTAALQAAHNAHVDRGDGPAALEIAERLLAIRTRVLGEENPETARAYYYLGGDLLMTGRAAEAHAAYVHALAVMERTHGREHAEVSDVLIGLMDHARATGHFTEALAFVDRSQVLVEKNTGRSHRIYGRTLLRRARIQNDLARSAETLATLREAEPLLLRTTGADSLEISDLRLIRGEALAHLGRHAAAREDVEASLAILDRVVGPGGPASAHQHLVLGHIQLALGKPRAALASFERALALFDPHDARVLRLRAECAFGIARTLTTLGENPARARELAELARTLLASVPALEHSLREIETWLARHTGGEPLSAR